MCCRLDVDRRLAIAIGAEQGPVCALRLLGDGRDQVLAAWDRDHFLIRGESLASYFDDDGSEILGTPDGGTAFVSDSTNPNHDLAYRGGGTGRRLFLYAWQSGATCVYLATCACSW
jgi:hypothetical protein